MCLAHLIFARQVVHVITFSLNATQAYRYMYMYPGTDWNVESAENFFRKLRGNFIIGKSAAAPRAAAGST